MCKKATLSLIWHNTAVIRSMLYSSVKLFTAFWRTSMYVLSLWTSIDKSCFIKGILLRAEFILMNELELQLNLSLNYKNKWYFVQKTEERNSFSTSTFPKFQVCLPSVEYSLCQMLSYRRLCRKLDFQKLPNWNVL